MLRLPFHNRKTNPTITITLQIQMVGLVPNLKKSLSLLLRALARAHKYLCDRVIHHNIAINRDKRGMKGRKEAIVKVMNAEQIIRNADAAIALS